jgi:hypothetical protein
MPTVLSKAVSATVTSSQKRHVYHPARRSRALKQSKADNQKFEAALDNEPDPYGWSYTSNARVFPEYKGGATVAWRITVRRRTHASQKTSTNKKSGARYKSQIVAENEMYAYRKSLEPKSIQSKLNLWEQSLSNLADPTSIVDETSTSVPTVVKKALTAARKRRNKSIAMSSNGRLQNAAAVACRNPKLPPKNVLQFTREEAVLTVQRWMRIRQLERGLAAKRIIEVDQTYRELLLKYLKKLIRAPQREEKWRQLLLGASDKEVAQTYSEYDRKHVMEKASFLLAAVLALYQKTSDNVPFSWEKACKVSASASANKFHWRTIQDWYLELHHDFDLDSNAANREESCGLQNLHSVKTKR